MRREHETSSGCVLGRDKVRPLARIEIIGQCRLCARCIVGWEIAFSIESCLIQGSELKAQVKRKIVAMCLEVAFKQGLIVKLRIITLGVCSR